MTSDSNRQQDIESFNIIRIKDTRQRRFDLLDDNRWMLSISVIERHCVDRRRTIGIIDNTFMYFCVTLSRYCILEFDLRE